MTESETTGAPRGRAFRATIDWIGPEPLLRGRTYPIELGGLRAAATVAPVKYRLDQQTGEHIPATTLDAGQSGVCELELDEELPFSEHGAAATFTLSDPTSGAIAGTGSIEFELRRSANVHWQAVSVDKTARSRRLRQRPTVIWLTGLSGAGKSTLANLLESELHRRGGSTYLLDGDNVRHGLNSDLGFTDADRVENIRRVGEVARLMVDAGLIVIVSFISPFRAERAMVRSLLDDGEFLEVHVDAPLAVVEARDPKGLYAKARRGELANFTGIDSPYEAPEDPELRIDTDALEPAEGAALVIEALEARGRLASP